MFLSEKLFSKYYFSKVTYYTYTRSLGKNGVHTILIKKDSKTIKKKKANTPMIINAHNIDGSI